MSVEVKISKNAMIIAHASFFFE